MVATSASPKMKRNLSSMISGGNQDRPYTGVTVTTPGLSQMSAGSVLQTRDIRVYPSKVEFHDIEVGVTHVLVISVQNSADQVKRIRFIPPSSHEFALHHVPQCALAPGLEVNAEIEFRTTEERDYHDRLIVLAEGERIEVPLHAYLPGPKIEFDGFVNFGVISKGSTSTAQVTLRNNGSRKGMFNFVYDKLLPMEIVPERGFIEDRDSGNNTKTVVVKYTAKEVGVFRALAQVELGGTQSKLLDVNSTVVAPTMELVSPDGKGVIPEVNFGSLYFMQERTITTYLVNNSPDNCSFFIKVENPVDDEDGEGGSRDENDDLPPPVEVDPPEGLIPPFEHVTLQFKLKPHLRPLIKGFKSTLLNPLDETEKLEKFVVIEAIETHQQIMVPTLAKVLKPYYSLSESQFNFGECPVHEHIDMLLTLKNESDELNLDWSIQKVAHFHVRPAKGKLLPLQSIDVICTFSPNQMGKFKEIVKMSFSGGIDSKDILFQGHSASESRRKKLIGGPDKVPEDFKPQLNFKEPREYQELMPKKKFKRADPWEESSEALFNMDLDVQEYTYAPEIMERRRNHREQYHEWLRQCYDDRKKKESRNVSGVKENDLGMEPACGLSSPRLELPATTDPLWLENPIEDDDISLGAGRRAGREAKQTHDENRLFKKKFKAAPTTAQEQKDCKAPILPKDFASILMGPMIMDFGEVCVQSHNAKSFTITNELKHTILVAVNPFEFEELGDSNPGSQVIPTGASAGFDIVFIPQAVGSFKKSVSVMVNGLPAVKFTVQATVVPVTVNLSTDVLPFRFAEHNLDTFMNEVVTLTNPHNHPAEYKWFVKSNLFTVTPASGSVEPFKSADVQVTFHPNVGQAKYEDSLLLKVVGGTEKELRCFGEIEEAKIAINEKKIDFGTVSVGIAREQTFMLKNHGLNDTVFMIETPVSGLFVTPQRGRIVARSSVEIKVELKPIVAQVYDTHLVINIRGGKTQKLAVVADAVVPDVQVQQDEFDFRGVTVGATARLPCTIRNGSKIPAILFLDLTPYADFNVEITPALEEKYKTELSEVICHVTDSNDPNAGVVEEGHESEITNNIWKFVIKEDSDLTFNISFSPQRVSSHAFELPLSIFGVPSTSALRRAVAGEGLRPRLVLSHTNVDFRERVIMDPKTAPKPYTMNVVFSNEDENVIFWEMDLKEAGVKGEIFSAEPSNGMLDSGLSQPIRITFTPTEAASYNYSVPIYLDKNMTNPYLEVGLRGTGTFPRLAFDVDRVVVPTVPLGIKSTAYFYVINRGYEQLDLRYRLPVDQNKAPISLSFPEGSQIGGPVEKVLVEVTFMSKKALAVTAKVDFLDHENNRFPIFVNAIADNCVLTVTDYLAKNLGAYQYHTKEGHLVNIQEIPREPGEDEDLYPMSPRSDDGENEVKAKESELQIACSTMVKFLNAAVLKEGVSSFPQPFIQSKGKLLVDMVEYLSGKRFSGAIRKFSNNKKEAAFQVATMYEDLLNFLKTYGALLHVQPDHLLSYGDYTKYRQHLQDINPDQAHAERLAESVFNVICQEAWITVIMQIVRVFVLQRITPKQFKNLPGLTGEVTKPDNTLSQSNVYSVSENLILKWLTYHYNKVNPIKQKHIARFDADLRDSTVFAAAMSAHVPNIARLATMNHNATDANQLEQNAQRILDAMKEIGLSYPVSVQDITNSNPRDMVLFSTYLYFHLPQFVPKTVIEFAGRLNETIVKNIELSNPSGRPLIYNIRIEGSQYFKVAETQVELPPKSRIQLPVEFYACFSKALEARLVLRGNGANTMVFILRSKITSRKAMATINSEAKCYEPQVVDMQVTNPFSVDCVFQVILQDLPPEKIGGLEPKKSNRPQRENKSAKKTETVAAKVNQPPVFICKVEQIKIKANETVLLQVQYVPLLQMNYRCHVLFCDEKVGEFVYEIVGAGLLPNTMDGFKFAADGRGTVTKDFDIPVKNPGIERAQAFMNERSKGKKLKKGEEEKVNDEANQIRPPDGPLVYTVEFSSPFFSGPKEFVMDADLVKKGAMSPRGSSKDKAPQLNFQFHPKEPGVYMCKLILRSNFDVRVYEVEGTVVSSGTKASLEFNSPAGQVITQEIPIINQTEKPWLIKAQIDGDYFTGAKEMQVAAMSRGSYVLQFKPEWKCTIEGELILNNATTGDRYTYELMGVGDDPLSEGHVVIECEARHKITHNFKVPNRSMNDEEYRVESDIPHVGGDSHISVDSKDSAEYELIIHPQVSGNFTGSLTFFAEGSEKFVWYTVEIIVTNPPAEKELEISAVLRKAVAVDITIANPLDHPIEFEVVYHGDGLLGDSFISVAAFDNAVYELIYSPLKKGSLQGSIHFIHEDVGEFWYKLSLNAEANPPEVLPELTSVLGGQMSHRVTIDNPLGEEIKISCRNDNPTNFHIEPSTPFTLEPYESLDVEVVYVPSSINTKEKANITLYNADAGEWQYIASGFGTMPDEMDPVVASSAIDGNTSAILAFRNPFPTAAMVDVSLITDEDPDVFKILLKRLKGLPVAPFTNLQIPYAFRPNRMAEHRATVLIEYDDSLKWKFPVVGIAECPPTEAASFEFKCRARSRLQQQITFNLRGVDALPKEGELLDHMLVIDPQHQAMMERALQFTMVDTVLKTPDQALAFNVTFEPLKPVKTIVELVIKRASGGRWRYNIQFEATEPTTDDTIVIEGEMHKITSVAFELTNQFDTSAPFQAYFSHESPVEFSVIPTQGMLPPYGGDGTQFVVSYRPTEYGKPMTGHLVIQTEEMQWTYVVKGTHPHYVAPVGIAQVDTRLDQDVAKHLAKSTNRNYVRRNMDGFIRGTKK